MNFVELYVKRHEDNISSIIKSALLKEDLNKKHVLYFNLVDFLAPLYPEIPAETFECLAYVTYGYFRSLLILDNLLDKDERKNHPNDLLIFLPLLESCIKELSYLYSKNNTFWQQFDLAKKAYFETVLLEKKYSLEKPVFTKDIFEKIAEGKSAVMCYNLVNALEVLSSNPERKKELFQFIKSLHIAFQYQDDISDFKADIQNNQWTYPRSLVEMKIRDNQLADVFESVDLKYKYLFTSNIATELLKEAEKQYITCIEIAKKLNLSLLQTYTEKELAKCSGQIKEINLLIQKTVQKTQKSQQKKFVQGETLGFCMNEAIPSGLTYLEKNLDENYQWSDFMTTAGTSQHWVTFYVLYMLNNLKDDFPVLNQVSERMFSEATKGAFNETIPEDGDSLNFFLGSLKVFDKRVEESLLNKWLGFMEREGGWMTYNQEHEIRQRLKLDNEIGLQGWTSSKNCVTAVACQILTLFDEKKAERGKTEAYLLKNQNEAGYWDSYWWTSPVYATSWAVQALYKNKAYHQNCKKAIDWLLQNQTEQGAWVDAFSQDESVFYTALALKALIITEDKQYFSYISKGINWLVHQQTTDGSWASAHILAIPATDVTDNKQIKKWRKSSFGVNIIVDDHNRIFTTATVLSTLTDFKNYFD